MAIVNANGYGHGAVQSSKVFIENGGDRLGVVRVTEGIEFRIANAQKKYNLK